MIYSIGVVCLCLIALLTRINKKTLLVLTFLFLTGIAILFEPEEGLDLFRHYQTLDVMRQIGYAKSVVRYHYEMGNLPVYSGFYYLVSLLRYDKLLLVITYLIVYGCLFHVLSMCVEDHGWSQRSWKLGYAIVMLLTNAYSVTGIRYTMAFAVVFLFIYVDLVRKQYRLVSLLAYILMCLLHDGMILVVLLRFLLYIPSNKVISKLKYMIVFCWVCIDTIDIFLRAIPIPYFTSVADKLRLYTTEEATNMWVSGVGLQTLAVMRIVLLVAIAAYCILARDKDDYVKMLQLLLLFCLGGLAYIALIGRYISITLLFAIPFILSINEESNFNEDSARMPIQVRMYPMLLLIMIYFVCLVLFQYQYFI